MIIRKCVKCEFQKELTKFRKRKRWFSHTCKECYAKQYRTGKPNLGRFQKGHSPTHGFKKENIPWNIGKLTSVKRSPYRGFYKIWKNTLLERDRHKCKKCGSKERLHGHHVLSWKDHESLRFDVDNGIILCNSCHSKIHFDSKIGIDTRFKSKFKNMTKRR